MSRSAIASVLMVSAFAVGLLAQAPQLNVRTGLWEITTVMKMGGDMPKIDFSQMPAAQRAQMEAVMKAMMNERTETSKSCVTAEDLKDGSFMTGDDDLKCQQAITVNTRTALESTVTCTGERTMTGKLRVDAPAPTTMNAKMNATTTEDGQTMTIDLAMTGKWLAADCGEVK
jgi:Protein of unknown function (DUF3617)